MLAVNDVLSNVEWEGHVGDESGWNGKYQPGMFQIIYTAKLAMSD